MIKNKNFVFKSAGVLLSPVVFASLHHRLIVAMWFLAFGYVKFPVYLLAIPTSMVAKRCVTPLIHKKFFFDSKILKKKEENENNNDFYPKNNKYKQIVLSPIYEEKEFKSELKSWLLSLDKSLFYKLEFSMYLHTNDENKKFILGVPKYDSVLDKNEYSDEVGKYLWALMLFLLKDGFIEFKKSTGLRILGVDKHNSCLNKNITRQTQKKKGFSSSSSINSSGYLPQLMINSKVDNINFIDGQSILVLPSLISTLKYSEDEYMRKMINRDNLNTMEELEKIFNNLSDDFYRFDFYYYIESSRPLDVYTFDPFNKKMS